MTLRLKDKELTAEFLKKIPLFKNFSEKTLQRVVDDFKVVTVRKGGNIVFQSDEGTDLYIVLRGKVKVSLEGDEGNKFILTDFGEGDFFGEMSLIDGKSRSANVTAVEETVLGVLPREIFLRTIKQDASIAFDFLTVMVERLRKANDKINTLAFLDVSERVVKFLIDEAKKEGQTKKDGYYRTVKRKHLELASHIGVSREAVTKALKALAFTKTVIEKEGYFLISPEV